MTDTAVQSDVTGNVIFYNQPEPLNAVAHANLGVNPSDKPFAFVSASSIVPLTVTEFAAASLSYPVIFMGDKKSPVAVMGIRTDDNLFVSAEGDFDPNAYLPAFVRRYPFVFANDDTSKRLVLCIDRGASIVSDGGEVKLFEDGKPTPFTDNAMQFCTSFEEERQRTDAFVKLMEEMDLFEIRTSQFTPRNPDGSAGEPQQLAEYFAISEEKLRALSIEDLAKLRDNGALGQIYAHLVSLLGWDRLVSRALQRMATGKPVANA